MKCTIVTKDAPGMKCGAETGQPCPPMWRKHAHFDPLVLRMFFKDGPGITQADLDSLDAFVCPAHLPAWQRKNAIGDRISTAKRAAIARKRAKPTEAQLRAYLGVP